MSGGTSTGLCNCSRHPRNFHTRRATATHHNRHHFTTRSSTMESPQLYKAIKSALTARRHIVGDKEMALQRVSTAERQIVMLPRHTSFALPLWGRLQHRFPPLLQAGRDGMSMANASDSGLPARQAITPGAIWLDTLTKLFIVSTGPTTGFSSHCITPYRIKQGNVPSGQAELSDRGRFKSQRPLLQRELQPERLTLCMAIVPLILDASTQRRANGA